MGLLLCFFASIKVLVLLWMMIDDVLSRSIHIIAIGAFAALVLVESLFQGFSLEFFASIGFTVGVCIVLKLYYWINTGSNVALNDVLGIGDVLVMLLLSCLVGFYPFVLMLTFSVLLALLVYFILYLFRRPILSIPLVSYLGLGYLSFLFLEHLRVFPSLKNSFLWVEMIYQNIN